MLTITSIKKGIVIDHIKAGMGVKIFNYLELNKVHDYPVALIINASSHKLGKKDIIKIENIIDLDLTQLGAFDSNMTINIIENESVSKKVDLSLPENLEGIFTCKNPRCITSVERAMKQKFELIDKEKGMYKCHYCDQIFSWED